jgi:hypothetical protein
MLRGCIMSKIYGNVYESQRRFDIIGVGTDGDSLCDLTKSELRQLMVDIQCALQILEKDKEDNTELL